MPLGLKRVTSIFAAFLFAALAAIACGGPSDSGSLIPEGATAVGDADLARIRAELDTETILDALLMDSDGSEGLAGAFFGTDSEFGVQFRNVTHFEFFGDASDADNYFGVIALGEFDQAAIIAALSTLGETLPAHESYKGHDVYSKQEGEDRISFSVADPETLLLGTERAVKASLDVLVGDREAASGDLIETLDGLGSRVFGLAAKVPAEALEDRDPEALSGLTGGLPISLDFLESIDTLGIAGELSTDSLGLKVVMEFNDEDSAQSMKDFVDGIVALVAGLSDDPRATELLSSMEANLDGNVLTFTVDVPKSQLSDLTGDLTNTAGTESTERGPAVAAAPAQPKLNLGEEVRVMPSALHVPDGQRVIYSTTPPTSGEHWANWADCGWYDQEIPDERAVHNLEHGNIVVSYNLTSDQEVEELKRTLERVAAFEEWGLARPYPQIPAGTIALTAWGRLATYQGVSPDDIGGFFQSFAGLLGPERIPC